MSSTLEVIDIDSDDEENATPLNDSDKRDYTRLIIPMHQSHNHWVVFVVDLVQFRILKYDSLPSVSNDFNQGIFEVSALDLM